MALAHAMEVKRLKDEIAETNRKYIRVLEENLQLHEKVHKTNHFNPIITVAVYFKNCSFLVTGARSEKTEIG